MSNWGTFARGSLAASSLIFLSACMNNHTIANFHLQEIAPGCQALFDGGELYNQARKEGGIAAIAVGDKCPSNLPNTADTYIWKKTSIIAAKQSVRVVSTKNAKGIIYTNIIRRNDGTYAKRRGKWVSLFFSRSESPVPH